MKAESHMRIRQSERFWTCIKNTLTKLALKKAYKSYVTEEESWQQRERQEVALAKHHYINEYTLVWVKEKAAYIAEREAARIILTVRFWLYESGIYKWHDMVKCDIEFEGGNIGGDWVIQKKDGYPTYNFAALLSMTTICISLMLCVEMHILLIHQNSLWSEAFWVGKLQSGHITLIINSERLVISYLRDTKIH